MDEKTQAKPKKKGFFALLKDSIMKSNEGCGPGCGCHSEKKKQPGSDGTKANRSK